MRMSSVGLCGPCGADSSLTASARSAPLTDLSISVVSAMRRVHSRTLPCSTKRSRSCAISTSPAACATSTAATVAGSRRPNRDWGHTDRRMDGRLLVAHDIDADDVPLAIHCLDDLRRTGVVAEYLAQTADAYVDAAVERVGVTPAQELGELGTGKHAVGGAEQHRHH